MKKNSNINFNIFSARVVTRRTFPKANDFLQIFSANSNMAFLTCLNSQSVHADLALVAVGRSNIREHINLGFDVLAQRSFARFVFSATDCQVPNELGNRSRKFDLGVTHKPYVVILLQYIFQLVSQVFCVFPLVVFGRLTR